MDLPLEKNLQTPESLMEWVREEGVQLDIQELDRYPTRPMIFSEYQFEPPVITIYRYLPLEDWLNLMCQRRIGYYGPWYCLHLAYRFYFHLELHGLFEIERKWYHRMWGRLNTLESRAYRFTQDILGTLHHPMQFDLEVRKSFRPEHFQSV